MFKKGQLIQSIKYGDYYVVTQPGPVHAKAKPMSPKKWPLPYMFVEEPRFRIVGNNYQAKPKCSR